MRDWLANLPCVCEGSVIVDMRGPWPIAYIGWKWAVIRTREDMFMFVAENLD